MANLSTLKKIGARGIVGDITGTVVPAGRVGEVFTGSVSIAYAAQNNWRANTTPVFTLPVGTWLLCHSFACNTTVTLAVGTLIHARANISTNNGNNGTLLVGSDAMGLIGSYASMSYSGGSASAPIVLTVTSPTAYYAKTYIDTATTITTTLNVVATAIRIA